MGNYLATYVCANLKYSMFVFSQKNIVPVSANYNNYHKIIKK